jgi:hypothetical protein
MHMGEYFKIKFKNNANLNAQKPMQIMQIMIIIPDPAR